MSRVVKTPKARRDLVDLADHIALASEAASRRFLAAAEQNLDDLAAMPEMGSPYESSSPRLQDLRVWPVRAFKKYLISYRPLGNGIEVVRVLHGARHPDHP